jgi:hypothetical protein
MASAGTLSLSACFVRPMCQVRTCCAHPAPRRCSQCSRACADPARADHDTYTAKAADIPQGRLHPWIISSPQLHLRDPKHVRIRKQFKLALRRSHACHPGPDRWLTKILTMAPWSYLLMWLLISSEAAEDCVLAYWGYITGCWDLDGDLSTPHRDVDIHAEDHSRIPPAEGTDHMPYRYRGLLTSLYA